MLTDHCDSVTMTVGARELKMEVLSTVLWLQGKTLVEQPCVDRSGHLLCWNGDVFGGLQGEIWLASHHFIENKVNSKATYFYRL